MNCSNRKGTANAVILFIDSFHSSKLYNVTTEFRDFKYYFVLFYILLYGVIIS